jgi:hypothetical protein
LLGQSRFSDGQRIFNRLTSIQEESGRQSE